MLKSCSVCVKSCGPADARLAENGWWLGERSLVDVYISWALGVAKRAGFSLEKYPHIDALAHRLEDWAAYRKMQKIEEEARRKLGLA